jgi:C-terminal peptidase prc
LALVVLAGLVGAVRADDDTPAAPYVVIVGVSNFQDPQIKPRKHAEADAKALYQLLLGKANLGVAPERIKLLLGAPGNEPAAQKATKENINKAIEWLEKSAGKDDMAIIAYFGQAAPVGERTCYFAVDSTFKERGKNAVLSVDIEAHLDKLKSQRFAAFVDAHFLGFDPGMEKMPDVNTQNLYREFIGNEETKEDLPSRVIFLPNSGLKPSLDLDKHGIFAQTLLNGLEGDADKEGYEPDGNITVSELVKYVRKQLPELARKEGKTNEEKSQSPVIFDFQSHDFILDFNPKAHAKALERLEKFKQLANTNQLDKALTEEGTHLLYRMPTLEAKQNLRKAYQRLADGVINVAEFKTQRQVILESIVMPEKEANRFAITVMKAAKVVEEAYVEKKGTAVLVDQAIAGMYKATNEKIPSHLQERIKNIKTLKDVDLIKLLSDARTHLGKREDLAGEKDLDAALHGMLGKLDPHTDWVDKETVRKFRDDTRGFFSGIGVQIRKNVIRDELQVVTPIINSPAYKAKIYANDIITKIIREVDSEGNPLDTPEVLPTKGMTTDQAVKKILGKPGTKVKIQVEREGEKEPLEFTLIRGKVEVESVLGVKRKADDSWDYVIDPENKICYLRLTQFSGTGHRDLERVMRELTKTVGIKGFILDLRFNPGGLLDQSVKIADLFIDDGLIVTVKPRVGPEISYVGKSGGSFTAFPMVCLVNGLSASASEIVSACLQDHGRAVVIGSRSYGKGSVQTIHPFETGGQIKLTTATYWRPSGRNINKRSTQGKDDEEWGVTPNPGFDIKMTNKELADLQEHMRESEIIRAPGQKAPETKKDFQDKQLDAALEYLRGVIKGTKVAAAKKDEKLQK